MKTTLSIVIKASLLAIISFAAIASSDQASVNNGRAPSAVFGQNGTLWVTFVHQQFVYLSSSTDKGLSYSAPVRVNQQPQNIYSDGENRPKIAIANNGYIYLSWSEKTSGRFNGDIHFARSIDGGSSFQAVKTINTDGQNIGHRFDSLLLTPAGDIYISWLDKRLTVQAKKSAQPYRGSSVFYSASTDQGNSFSNNLLAADHSCECCRMAIAPSGKHDAVIMWRQIFEGGIRDHAISRLSQQQASKPYRATVDQWKTDACPHHGPSLAPAFDERYHMTWFSHGEQHKGLYYARFDFNSKTHSKAVLIDDSPSASHSFVKQVGDMTWIAWVSFQHGRSQLNMQSSSDQGLHWSTPRIISTTLGEPDHPMIIAQQQQAYITWFTPDEGLRLFPLNKQVQP